MAPTPAPKKRGRPPKVFSKDTAKNAELHKPHDCWDFTDYVVPYQPLMEYSDASDLTGPAIKRMTFWTGLGDSIKTLEIAHEICPDTQRPHGQGRIRFTRKIRFEALKKLLPPDVHFEPSVCTKCDMYLRKHDSITLVKIDNRHQGKRNIFREQHDAISTGATVTECAQMDGANYQSVRSAELLMKYIEPERATAPREVQQVDSAERVPANVYRLQDYRYWDGYDAHSAIYIRQGICKLTLPQLRQICGSAPFRLPRGRQARHNIVYISGLDSQERKALRLG